MSQFRSCEKLSPALYFTHPPMSLIIEFCAKSKPDICKGVFVLRRKRVCVCVCESRCERFYIWREKAAGQRPWWKCADVQSSDCLSRCYNNHGVYKHSMDGLGVCIHCVQSSLSFSVFNYYLHTCCTRRRVSSRRIMDLRKSIRLLRIYFGLDWPQGTALKRKKCLCTWEEESSRIDPAANHN